MTLAQAKARIGEGGPLRRLESMCHLTRPFTQVAVALAVAWVPMMVLALVSEHVYGRYLPLVHDAGVHVRLLIGVPVLLVLDSVFPFACTQAIDQLTRYDFIRADERPRFETLLKKTVRLGEAWFPELVLACVALGIGLATLQSAMPAGAFSVRHGPAAAEWWYAVIALPLFEFLIMRSLWRWIVWVRFLVGLSRLRLDLDVTHPDCNGGIAFLRAPSIAYCALLLLVASAVMSASWADRFQFSTLRSFVPMLLLAAAIGTVVAFGPLLLFTRQLLSLRREGYLAVGGLAAQNGRWFRDRLMDSPPGTVITSSEIQSLAALASTYRDTVNSARVLPFERKDIILVLAASLAPVLPSMVARIPHAEWALMASFVFSKTGIP